MRDYLAAFSRSRANGRNVEEQEEDTQAEAEMFNAVLEEQDRIIEELSQLEEVA